MSRPTSVDNVFGKLTTTASVLVGGVQGSADEGGLITDDDVGDCTVVVTVVDTVDCTVVETVVDCTAGVGGDEPESPGPLEPHAAMATARLAIGTSRCDLMCP